MVCSQAAHGPQLGLWQGEESAAAETGVCCWVEHDAWCNSDEVTAYLPL